MFAGTTLDQLLTYTLTDKTLLYGMFSGSSSVSSIDGNAVTGDAGLGNPSEISIFDGGVTKDCYIFEYIAYDSDQSANRAGLEANINAFYTIF